MKVNRICFENYRNLQKGEVDACDGINVIYGDNAHGKTNLLEAIWLFSGARSFRGAKDAECVNHSSEFAKLSMDFDAEGRSQNAEIVINRRRNAKLNGVQLKSGGELAGHFRAVVFSPEHLSLIKSGPSERRRFLDIAIGQLWPKYIPMLSQYMRAVTQRNAVLKDARFHSQLFDMLDAYEGEISSNGAKIISYRKKYIALLAKIASEVYSGISGGKEELSLQYLSIDEGENADNFASALKTARNNDIYTGSTSVGPHRDDISVKINGLEAKKYGSQGQQRSAVITLKLSEAALVQNITGEQPVILLDDVMSELDEMRQDYILNRIEGRQVFITCCDRNSVGMLKNGVCFHVRNGVVTKEA